MKFKFTGPLPEDINTVTDTDRIENQWGSEHVLANIGDIEDELDTAIMLWLEENGHGEVVDQNGTEFDSNYKPLGENGLFTSHVTAFQWEFENAGKSKIWESRRIDVEGYWTDDLYQRLSFVVTKLTVAPEDDTK